jgi:hypothetical protein
MDEYLEVQNDNPVLEMLENFDVKRTYGRLNRSVLQSACLYERVQVVKSILQKILDSVTTILDH